MNDAYGTRSLREIARIVFQHWFMLLFLVVLGTGGTYAVCRHVAPTYLSKVGLMFKRPLNRSPISADQGDRALEVFVKAQQQIVMSDLVLARALVASEDKALREKWVRLQGEWEAARVQGGEALARIQEKVGKFVEDELGGKVQAVLRERQEDLKDFRDAVKLETPGGEQVALTESFTLSVKRPSRAGEPESYKNAMYAADALADMYMVRFAELEQALNDPALRVMQDVIKAYERESEGDIQAYQRFVEEHSAEIGILEQLLKSGTEHGTQVVLTKVRENDARLVLDLARDGAIHEVMKSVLPARVFEEGGIDGMTAAEVEAAVAGVSVDFLQNNIGLAELVKEVAGLEAKRARLETQYTEANREVQYLREEVLQAKRQVLRAIAAHAKGLEASLAARKAQKAQYDELVEQIATEQNQTQAKLAEYAQLKNNFLVAQKHLERLQQEKLDAMTNRLRARDAVTITKLDQASMPEVGRPVTPKTSIYTVVAFVVSSLVGTALVFLGDHFDHTLRSAVEAERYLGVPVLGSVKKRGRRLIVGL